MKFNMGFIVGFPCGLAGKESASNVGDLGSISALGRSPGEGNGYSLQYSGLENFMDCIVHWVTKSRTGQQLSLVRLFVTLWTVACQAPLSSTMSWSLCRLMCIESAMPSNHLTLCHFLLLPSTFPSIRIFSNELALCFRWPKYWSFSNSPSSEE